MAGEDDKWGIQELLGQVPRWEWRREDPLVPTSPHKLFDTEAVAEAYVAELAAGQGWNTCQRRVMRWPGVHFEWSELLREG